MSDLEALIVLLRRDLTNLDAKFTPLNAALVDLQELKVRSSLMIRRKSPSRYYVQLPLLLPSEAPRALPRIMMKLSPIFRAELQLWRKPIKTGLTIRLISVEWKKTYRGYNATWG